MSMTRDELLELHKYLCCQARTVMEAKNHDYTCDGDPFANFRASECLGVDPVISILVRTIDKLQRIRTFVTCGELRVKGEGVKNSIVDIINYAVLAAGLIYDNVQRPLRVVTESELEQEETGFASISPEVVP